MSDPFSDRYWLEEFQVTQADLDRISDHIRETGQAHDLTALARRVVRGRLRYGPEVSAPVQSTEAGPSVRLWDPAGEWQPGDHTIIWTWSHKARRSEAMIGEITDVDSTFAHIVVDDRQRPMRTFRRAEAGSPEAIRWHQVVRKAVEDLRRESGQDAQIGAIILEHGERVASQLKDALRADKRFVRLAGRWFLRELAVSPTEEQLTALAWAMVGQVEPQPTEALVPLVQPPLATGDSGLFGLYLAIRERSALFENADPGQRPRWALAGLPPGACTPRYAAYDPETYEVLCLPGRPVPPEVVKRLWGLGLLGAVIG
jgi:hypothetical protein